jgi:CubicO group peptidase (beta-lactamase class C family)
MSKIIFPIALACSFFITINTFAESSKSAIQKIDAIVNQAHQLVDFNGSVTIANYDGVIYQNAIGFADHDKKINLTTEHLLSTGSISKEFSTVALIMLEEEGKVHYYDKVNQYLTNLPPWGSEVTIEQILSHTSGLPQIEWSLNLDTAAIKKQLMSIKSLAFAPGTDYLYGNLNVLLRAWVIENNYE